MEKYITQVCAVILKGGIVKATKYLSDKKVIRATLTLHGKKMPAKYDNTEITLTIGRPNYLERDFIRDCKAAKEPFPVKNVIVKSYNPPRPKKNLKKKN